MSDERPTSASTDGQLLAQIADRCERIESTCDGLAQSINGDGSTGKPGLRIRVDRLEVSGKRQRRAFYAAISAVVAGVVAFFGDLVTRLLGR